MERVQVSEVAKIKDLWHEYVASVNASDLERWLAIWVEDGIQLPPDAPRRSGKAMIRAEMQPLIELFDWQMAVYPDKIQVLGEEAYAYGLYEFVITPKEGGDSMGSNGKFLTILRKQIDESWKIVIDCFNYDAPFR